MCIRRSIPTASSGASWLQQRGNRDRDRDRDRSQWTARVLLVRTVWLSALSGSPCCSWWYRLIGVLVAASTVEPSTPFLCQFGYRHYQYLYHADADTDRQERASFNATYVLSVLTTQFQHEILPPMRTSYSVVGGTESSRNLEDTKCDPHAERTQDLASTRRIAHASSS